MKTLMKFILPFALALLAAMPFLMALANPPAVETAKPVGRPRPSPTPPPTTYAGHIVYGERYPAHLQPHD